MTVAGLDTHEIALRLALWRWEGGNRRRRGSLNTPLSARIKVLRVGV